MSEPETKAAPKILSMEEIKAGLSDMAQNGEGAQRAQAYRMLMNMESSAVMYAEPMGDGELIERLARMMKGVGAGLTQMAYKKAFPTRKDAVWVGPHVRYADATEEMAERARKIKSLKSLYRNFPRFKQSGIPKGFPSNRSPLAKMEWCQQTALKIMVEEVIEVRKKAHEDMMSADDLARGATDGSLPVHEPEV